MKVVDPVCKMEMVEKWVKYKSEYKGQTYYFGDQNHKKMFEEDPERYLRSVSQDKPQ